MISNKVLSMKCFIHLTVYFSICFAATLQKPFDGEQGDSCDLHDGSKGICRLDKECNYVKDLLKNGKRDQIKWCGFKDREPISCCKEKFTKRFSTDILCEGNLRKIPLKIKLVDHIVNGRDADINEFPHMAAIGYESQKTTTPTSYEFRCGGTLISDNYVLTAAHCVNRNDAVPVIVRLGKTSLYDDNDGETATDVKIERIITHEDYKNRLKTHDIALLKLEKPVKFAHNIWPACLSFDTQGLLKNMSIIGFGVKNNDDKSTSKWLLKAEVDEFPLDECIAKFKTIPASKPIIKGQVCAHSPISFSDTCQGDSGGSMSYKKDQQFFVYGITSYGIACGSEFPSIYTRVDQYIDWIADKIES